MADTPAAALYSLWAVPTGATADKLQNEIDAQAEQYDMPKFPPHVTVAPGISGNEADIIEQTAQLATSLQPYFVRFLDVTVGAQYFQCVYLLCAKDAGVMAAGDAARAKFQLETPPYMPHLSLLYSDMDAAGRQGAAGKALERLYGDKASHDTLLPEHGFQADKLQLWYTPDDFTCKSWRLVGEFPLTGGPQQ